MSNSPRVVHQRAAAELIIRLSAYVRPARLGDVLMSPADIELEPDSTVSPDVFVVPPIDGHRAQT